MKYLRARKLNESSARDNLTFLTLPILTRYPECASSHLRNKTAFSPSPSSVQNDLWPEVLQKFPILSFYVRSLMKWHTVSVNIPRGSYYKRKIYRNRLYISLSNLPTIPLSCLNITIYINIQNTRALFYRLSPSPFSPYPPSGIASSGSPLSLSSDLSVKPHLICC